MVKIALAELGGKINLSLQQLILPPFWCPQACAMTMQSNDFLAHKNYSQSAASRCRGCTQAIESLKINKQH